MRPFPTPLRSARSWNVSRSTITTSFVVFPSSSPLSGSFDVAETSVIVGVDLSVAATVASTVTYWWFGGLSAVGESVTVSSGGVDSQIPASTGS